jgi:hypothetical protein
MDNNELVKAIVTLNSEYFETGVDDEVASHLDLLTINSSACFAGAGSKLRNLIVIGESNTGKSTTLAHHFRQRKEFQLTDVDATVRPFISLKVDDSSDIRSLVSKILRELGMPVSDNSKIPLLKRVLKEQIKERGVRFLYLDEMQDILKTQTEFQVRTIQSFLKSITEIDGWPLHCIYSGTPKINDFLQGGDELSNRSKVYCFDLLDPQRSLLSIRSLVLRVVACGELSFTRIDEGEFCGRLIAASKCVFGTVIEITRDACFNAMRNGRSEISVKDFAEAYFQRTACAKANNVFTATRWEAIDPKKVFDELNERTVKGKKRK